MSEHEEWRPVQGWGARYEVSNLGRLRKLNGALVGQWRLSLPPTPDKP